MKKLIALFLGGLLAALSLSAQTLSQSITGGTAANLLSTSGYIIDSITFTATTTNTTTVKIYDSSTTATNYVAAAYTAYASYATNFTTVFTNEADLLVTNTFSGRWTYPTSVSAATNERPRVMNFVVPASGQRTREAAWIPGRGVTLLSDQSGIVEVNYRRNE